MFDDFFWFYDICIVLVSKYVVDNWFNIVDERNRNVWF